MDLRPVQLFHGSFPLLCVLLSGYCARAEMTTAAPATQDERSITATAERIRELKQAYPAAEVQVDKQTGQVVRISALNTPPDFTAQTPLSPVETARQSLQSDSIAELLGLTSDLREFCDAVSRSDPQIASRYTVRLQQCLNGVPVMGAEVVVDVQMRPGPAVSAITSNIVPGLKLDTRPRVSASAAVEIAAQAVEKLRTTRPTGQGFPQGTTAASESDPELVVFDPKRFGFVGPPRLCWSVRRDGIVVLIDATDGAIVHQYAGVVR